MAQDNPLDSRKHVYIVSTSAQKTKEVGGTATKGQFVCLYKSINIIAKCNLSGLCISIKISHVVIMINTSNFKWRLYSVPTIVILKNVFNVIIQ